MNLKMCEIYQSNMKKMALLVLAVVLLTGCEKTVYRTNLEVYCPPLKSYSTDFNEILAAEFDVLDEGIMFSAFKTTVVGFPLFKCKGHYCFN